MHTRRLTHSHTNARSQSHGLTKKSHSRTYATRCQEKLIHPLTTHSPTHSLTPSLGQEKQKQDLQKKVWVVHRPCLLGSGSEIINRLLTVSKKLHDTVCPSVGYPDQWSNDEIIYAKYPFSRRLSAWQPQSLPFHQLPLCAFPLEIPVPTSYPFFPPHPATPSPESRHAPVLRVMKLFFLAFSPPVSSPILLPLSFTAIQSHFRLGGEASDWVIHLLQVLSLSSLMWTNYLLQLCPLFALGISPWRTELHAAPVSNDRVLTWQTQNNKGSWTSTKCSKASTEIFVKLERKKRQGVGEAGLGVCRSRQENQRTATPARQVTASFKIQRCALGSRSSPLDLRWAFARWAKIRAGR